MRLSDTINTIRPATFAEKAATRLIGVSGGIDVTLPYPHAGWINVADSQYTSAARLTILSGIKTQLTINGLGASTNRDYADGMHSDVWSDNRFKPFALGDVYNLRLTCTMSQSNAGTGNYVIFDADIGTDAVPFLAAEQSVQLVKGQGVATLTTISAPFFCLDTFGRNGARLFLTPSTDITVWGLAIFIQRTFTP